MKPVVIYHEHCIDGFTAAWAFWHHYKDAYEYYPASYGNPGLPVDVLDRDVYLVDFCYGPDKIEEILLQAKSLTIIDHHESSLLAIAFMTVTHKLDLSHCSLARSGAGLAWEYLKKKGVTGKAAPKLLLHVEDRDLWKFSMPQTKTLLDGLQTIEKTFENYERFMRSSQTVLKELLLRGNAYAYIRDEIAKMAMKDMVILEEVYIDNNFTDVAVINVPAMFVSDVCEIVYKSTDYQVVMSARKTSERVNMSIRSNKDANYPLKVNDFAKQYGGGGHPFAAGFSVPHGHFKGI